MHVYKNRSDGQRRGAHAGEQYISHKGQSHMSTATQTCGLDAVIAYALNLKPEYKPLAASSVDNHSFKCLRSLNSE